MKNRINYINRLALLFCLSFVISCGISTEVRTASTSLLEKQKTSLEAHKDFHSSVIKSLQMFLDAEAIKSQKGFEEAKKNYQKAFIDEIKVIYADTNTTLVEKRVKEEEVKINIDKLVLKAEQNQKKRNDLITKAQSNLLNASQSIIEAEKAKTLAIEKLDKYIQEKRPSERLLDLINIDLANYSGFVTEANNAIEKAESIIDQLNQTS